MSAEMSAGGLRRRMEIVATSGSDLEFDRCIRSKSQSVRVDLSAAEHLSLYNVVTIACALMVGSDQGRELSFRPPKDPGVCNFLARIGFATFSEKHFELDCGLLITNSSTRDNVLVDLRTFESTSDLGPIQDLLFNRLHPVAPGDVVSAFDEALCELVANVGEHSGGRGVVAALVQGERRDDKHIDLVIGDSGIGIRESFLRQPKCGHFPTTDHEAITLALDYLVSSVAGDAGRGQGLWTTADTTKDLGGRIVIRSG